MHRIINSFLTMVIAPAFFFSVYPQEDIPSLVKIVQPSIVMIITYDAMDNPLMQGTGFFINEKGDIVSNRHVFKGSVRAENKTHEGNVYPINALLAEDINGDLYLASVNIPLPFVHPLEISTLVPTVGEKIVVIGNPFGLEQTVSDGIISAVREIPSFGNIIQMTAPISSGSSGSPVVNLNGDVIGVATLNITQGQNLNFAIPSARIAKLSNNLFKKSNNSISAGTKQKRNPTEEMIKSLSSSPRKSKDDSLNEIEDSLFMADTLTFNKRLDSLKPTTKEDSLQIVSSIAERYLLISKAFCKGGGFRTVQVPLIIKACKLAIKTKPYYIEAFEWLQTFSFYSHTYQDVIVTWKQVIQKYPDSIIGYQMLGASYRGLERYDDAIAVYIHSVLSNAA